jgi:dienelactone hydrolase
MNRLLQGAFALLLAQSAHAAPAVAAHELTRADGSTIHYYLQLRSAGAVSRELLVVIQGSDCNSVQHISSIAEHLGNVLPEADLLTVEKYGIDASLPYELDPERADCPTAYLQNDNLRQRLKDYRSVITQVRKQNAYQRVVVLGGSEGAVVAASLANWPTQVDAVVWLNGGGRWFIDDVLHNIEMSSESAAQKAEGVKEFREFAEHVRSGPATSLTASNHGYIWWKQMLEIDQLAILKRATVPMLVMQGGADHSVSPAKFNNMAERLVAAGKDNIQVRRYPLLDHGFRGADKKSRMGEVADDIRSWLKSLDQVKAG